MSNVQPLAAHALNHNPVEVITGVAFRETTGRQNFNVVLFPFDSELVRRRIIPLERNHRWTFTGEVERQLARITSETLSQRGREESAVAEWHVLTFVFHFHIVRVLRLGLTVGLGLHGEARGKRVFEFLHRAHGERGSGTIGIEKETTIGPDAHVSKFRIEVVHVAVDLGVVVRFLVADVVAETLEGLADEKFEFQLKLREHKFDG